MNPIVKKIRTIANVGLYGSLGVSVLTLALFFFWHYRFYVNEAGFRFMLIAGSVLAVLALAVILLVVRRAVPRLRQLDDVDQKLSEYYRLMANLYRGSLGVVVAECVLITLSHANQLFMLLMVLVLLLFLVYPNMLKLKVDLGLNDEQMDALFGTEYKS